MVGAVGGQHHAGQFDCAIGFDRQVTLADEGVTDDQAACRNGAGGGFVLQHTHIARTVGVQAQGVDLGGQVHQPGLTAGCGQADHGGLYGEGVRQNQATGGGFGDGPFGRQNHVATASVAKCPHGERGGDFGGSWCLGGGEDHVVGIAAAQGAGRADLQRAKGAQVNGAVKGLGIRQHQVAQVAQLNVARTSQLDLLHGGHFGLQGDGVFGQHLERVGLDQAGDHLHVIGFGGGAPVVQQFGLRDIARLGAELNAGSGGAGLQRAAAQADMATKLAGTQAQVTGGGVQTGIAVGGDTTVFGCAQARLHGDAARICRAADGDIAV